MMSFGTPTTSPSNPTTVPPSKQIPVNEHSNAQIRAVLLQELDSLHRNQLYRLHPPADLDKDCETTNLAVNVSAAPEKVAHALGRRKPSLEELELEGAPWMPRLVRRRS